MENQSKISVIIPVYNEESAIGETIENLKNYLKSFNVVYEIIAVNDGSTDKSGEVLKNIEDIKLIEHPYNKGYGAAIKTGVKNAQYDWVLFFDSDGQHQPQYIGDLLSHKDKYDLIIGIRTKGTQITLSREPGKKILNWIANYLVEQKIPDLTSGFRLVKKENFLHFIHILPNSFSISATSTLAFLKEGYNVKYVPIIGKKRIGKSSLKLRDGFKVLILILRIMMLFSPLRIFLPISIFLLVFALASLAYDISQVNLTETTALLFLASFLIFFFGFLADQISNIRREK